MSREAKRDRGISQIGSAGAANMPARIESTEETEQDANFGMKCTSEGHLRERDEP